MAEDNLEKDHVHDGNCEHEFDEEQLTVTLTLEDDSEIECNVLGTFDVDDEEYIAVLPIGSEEVLIYKYVEDNGNIELLSIEDDKEFELVSEIFYSLFGEDEEDEDDGEDEE